MRDRPDASVRASSSILERIRPTVSMMMRGRNTMLALVVAGLCILLARGPVAHGAPEVPTSPIDSTVDAMALTFPIHGIQYTEAHSLGEVAIPRLRFILQDEAKKRYWGNATAMLGSIGTPEAYRILDHFVWKRFRGEVDSDTYWALTSAVSVLGMTCGPGNTAATQDLSAGASPEWWVRLPWHVRGKSDQKVHALLSRLALRGLGYCVDAEADRVLATFEHDPRFNARKHEIADARALNVAVTRNGLGAYMKAQRQEHER